MSEIKFCSAAYHHACTLHSVQACLVRLAQLSCCVMSTLMIDACYRCRKALQINMHVKRIVWNHSHNKPNKTSSTISTASVVRSCSQYGLIGWLGWKICPCPSPKDLHHHRLNQLHTIFVSLLATINSWPSPWSRDVQSLILPTSYG